MRGARPGFCLLELLLALGLMGILGGLGGLAVADRAPGHAALSAVQGELRASVEQAFLLARARGCEVNVAPGGHTPACRGRHAARESAAIPPLTLPRGVRWGIPYPAVPLPMGKEHTVQAHIVGWAHPCITVTPRGTTQGSSWYLSAGRDAVCLSVDDFGRITLQRWRHPSGPWRRV